MNKYILALVSAVIVSFSTVDYLSSQIIESETIDNVLPLIDEETWFLVDLDNTVFQAKQALGHVNWLQHEVQKHITAGKSREEAFYSLYPLWKKTQMMTDVVPVEASFLEAIKQLQNRHIVVMGLTHRQLFIVPETLRQLNSIGISFQETAPSPHTMNIPAKQPALYTQGILFVDEQALQLMLPETENKEINMEQHSTPEYLYKIVSKEQWQESLLQNKIVSSSLDMDFIHLAKEDQVTHVVQKFWNNMDHIVLKLASKKLMGRLIYETNPGGTTKYYHLYDGNIPLEAVKDVTVVHITNNQ